MALKILVGGYTTIITALLYTPSTSGGKGSLSVNSTSKAGSNPSWIALNPEDSSVLYANQENVDGHILSFTIDPDTAVLSQKSSVSTGGSIPSNFGVLYGGEEIMVANYKGSSTSDFVLPPDRTKLPSKTGPMIQYTGSGPNPTRQTIPHPHHVIEHIVNTEVLVADLGSDKVWRLRRSPSTSDWEIADFVQHEPGSGPRHIAVDSGQLYTVNELSNTLTQHTLPPLGSGVAPELVATLPTIPPGASNTTLAAAEILLSPLNCKFTEQHIYVTNRYDSDPQGDTIAIFSINPLKLVTHVRTGLHVIRGAAIGGSNADYLVAGGQNGGGVVLYLRTDGGTTLTEMARNSEITSPSSFVFLPAGQNSTCY